MAFSLPIFSKTSQKGCSFIFGVNCRDVFIWKKTFLGRYIAFKVVFWVPKAYTNYSN